METHEDIKMTLPWFANGTLNERELERVNRHLDDCDDCREEVEQLLRLSQRFSQPTLDDPRWQPVAAASKHAFMDQLATVSGPVKASYGTTLQQYVALAASVVLVIAIVLAPWLREEVPNVYLPQSAEPVTMAPESDGTVVQLVFRPDTSEDVIGELMSSDTLTLIGAPSEKGVYRVQLSSQSDVMRQLDHLRGHPYVIFAQLETP